MHRTTIKTPQISVVMSIYNEPEEWLRESIDSILNQTFTDFEFIIINDNPERQLNDTILKEYQKKDNRIVIIENEKNIGLTKSLNKGIKQAKGKYIARMDGDDISLPHRLEKQYYYMTKNSNCIVCGSSVKFFGIKKGIKYYPMYHFECINLLFLNSCFAHPSVMLRKRVIVENNKYYKEDYLYSQDYRFWVDLVNYGEFHNIKETLLKYRISGIQISITKSIAQNNFAYLSRKKLIHKLIIDKDIKQKLFKSTFTPKQIKFFSKKTKYPSIIPLLWLSLNKYSLSVFMYYLFSFDWVYCTLKQNLAILKRFMLGPNKLI
jgi:glycosyltransferase involved in cell wall biosynthesis